MVDLPQKEQIAKGPIAAGGAVTLSRLAAAVGWVLKTPGRATGLLFVFFLLSIAQRLHMEIAHDVLWYLHSAGALLDGGHPYRDIFFGVNPPLTLYLSLPPVALARWLDVFPVTVFYLYIFALCALSLALCRFVLAHRNGLSEPVRRGLLLGMALMLVVLPAGDFGQREHLMVALSLPYVLLAAIRAHALPCPKSLALISGVTAAIGFCIKPHFLLIPIAIEVFLWCRHRSLGGLFRPETLALTATGLLYAMSLPLLTPDYLTKVVPLVLELYNVAYRNDLTRVLGHHQVWLLPLVALLLLSNRQQGVMFQASAALFLLVAGCFLVIYLQQMKGWSYQLYPVSALLFLALSWHLAGALSETAGQPGAGDSTPPIGKRHALTLVPLLGLLLPSLLEPEHPSAIMAYIGDTVRKHAQGGPFFAFSADTWTTFPLVTYTDATMNSRFAHLWTLPGLTHRRRALGPQAPAEDLARLDEAERFTRNAVIADLMAAPPTVILVDARTEKYWFSGPFDFIAFFSADPRFAAIWKHYEQIADFSGFQIYRRCPGACGAPSSG